MELISIKINFMKKDKKYSVQIKLSEKELDSVIKAIEGYVEKCKYFWEFQDIIPLYPKFKALKDKVCRQRRKDEKRRR